MNVSSLSSKWKGWFLDDGIIGDELSILQDIKVVLKFCNDSGIILNST